MPNITSIYSLGYKTGQVSHEAVLEILSPSIPSGMIISISSVPYLYTSYLLQQDPLHVAIETVLLAFLIYIIATKRKKDWEKDMRELLTESEKQEIITEWKAARAPLWRELDAREANKLSDKNRIVVHEVKGSKLVVTDFSKMKENFKKQTNASSSVPTKTLLNMASHDFLGMGSNEQIKEVSRSALKKYGCGACGPRGFYGTHDVHLDLEKEMSRFCEAEAAILYADAASTTSSTVSCFCKRGDVLVVDDGIYEALQSGVTISRSNVHFFKHNDMVSYVIRGAIFVSILSTITLTFNPQRNN